jgi:hypothetical protein
LLDVIAADSRKSRAKPPVDRRATPPRRLSSQEHTMSRSEDTAHQWSLARQQTSAVDYPQGPFRGRYRAIGLPAVLIEIINPIGRNARDAPMCLATEATTTGPGSVPTF